MPLIMFEDWAMKPVVAKVSLLLVWSKEQEGAEVKLKAEAK